jgi:hypothetical protein
MASTTFIDQQTIIYADWLNDVNSAVYNGVFPNGSLTLTTLSVSGSVSGAGFTSLVNNTLSAPGAIGSATPNTGAFTTLQATSLTGLTTPLSIGQGGTGLSSVGTSGYALASNGSALVYKKLGLGLTGEVWNNVVGSRAINTTYTNSNAYPIMVNFAGALNGVSQATITLQVGSITVGQIGQNTAGGSTGLTGTMSAIVPPGVTYAVNSTGCTVSYWTELY